MEYVEDYDERCSQVSLEEIDRQLAASHSLPANWSEAGPELRYEDEDVEYEADPRSPDADRGGKCQFVQAVALEFPGSAEADV